MFSRESKRGDVSFKLFIYDSRRGNTETTEKEKILAFFPTTVNIDEQLSTVGLAQTFALFTGTFSGDSNFITLDTDKRKWAVLTFEPGIWIGLVVKKDWGPGKAGNGGCKVFLEDLCGYVSLLYGSVQRLLELDATGKRARASLQSVIETWGELMTRNRSEEKAKYENPISLQPLGAIPTLSLTRTAFINLQVLAQDLLSFETKTNAAVRYVMLCFDRYLLWSDLNGKCTRQLYSFVEKNGLHSESKGVEKSPTMMHFIEEEDTKSLWMVPIYKAPLSIFLLLDANLEASISFDSLNEGLKQDVHALVQAAALQLSNVNDYHIAGYRYVNLDRSGHLGYATPPSKIKTLSEKTIHLLSYIQSKVDETNWLADEGGDFEKTIKGEHGGWVTVRKAGSKILYVALDILEEFSLSEVDDYVSRMCNKHFPGVFEL